MNTSRRALLKGGAGLIAGGAFAGCLGDGNGRGTDGGTAPDEPDGPHAYAAFFALWDWTRNVAGDRMEVVNPVPTGEIGHGWEPPTDLPSKIADSDAFVYLDTPEFRWAQDAVDALESEGSNVVTIDALRGLELREWDGGDRGDHEGEGDGHGADDHEDDGHGEEDHEHEGDGHGEDDHDDHDDHDERGEVDPHVWVDPVIAQRCVDTIAEGLAEADPDGADAYRENAESYKSELRELHETFEAELADRGRDTFVVAAHDSYQYLAARYGFEVHSPQGVSPQDTPSQSEIIDTIELVNELGVTHVAYNVFESDQLAETIVAESDATETVPLSSAEGTTREWNENGWGYVEQMKEINLPAVEAGLGIQE